MNEKLEQLKRFLRRWLAPTNSRRPDFDRVRNLARGIITTQPDEIDCSECFERLDQYAEMIETGKSPFRAMAMVQDHLERCPDCKQEFLALIKVLQEDPGSDAQRPLAPWPIS